jgi:uncharacterized membrane protein
MASGRAQKRNRELEARNQELAEKNRKLEEELEQASEQVASFSFSETKFSATTSPIPDSGELSKLEEVIPGSAKRILRMAEKEQDARQRWMFFESRSSLVTTLASILMTGTVAVFSLQTAAQMFQQNPIAAAAIGIGPIATISAAAAYSVSKFGRSK